VLRKAKFIKEGSFSETDGIPVIKVTGNIDLAGKKYQSLMAIPDDTHPYIQRQLARSEYLEQDLYALVWYYKMKEANKYHLAITTSKNSKDALNSLNSPFSS
jgi:hypothetical protein